MPEDTAVLEAPTAVETPVVESGSDVQVEGNVDFLMEPIGEVVTPESVAAKRQAHADRVNAPVDTPTPEPEAAKSAQPEVDVIAEAAKAPVESATPEAAKAATPEPSAEVTRLTAELATLKTQYAGLDPAVVPQILQDALWVRNVYIPEQQRLRAQAQAKPAEVAPQPTSEELLDQFTANPAEVMARIARETALEVLRGNPEIIKQVMLSDPKLFEQAVPELQEARTMSRLLNDFNKLSESNPELQDQAFQDEVLPVMREIYASNPDLHNAPNAMQNCYERALGKIYRQSRSKQQATVAAAVKIATEQAARNHADKLKAGVDGALSTPPSAGGQAPSNDPLDAIIAGQQRWR